MKIIKSKPEAAPAQAKAASKAPKAQPEAPKAKPAPKAEEKALPNALKDRPTKKGEEAFVATMGGIRIAIALTDGAILVRGNGKPVGLAATEAGITIVPRAKAPRPIARAYERAWGKEHRPIKAPKAPKAKAPKASKLEAVPAAKA